MSCMKPFPLRKVSFVFRQPPDLDFDVHACKWVERRAKREVIRKHELDPHEKGQSRSRRAGVV